ncbi:MAG: hypothetical protein ACRDQC_10135 [Gaiellales bacterium]
MSEQLVLHVATPVGAGWGHDLSAVPLGMRLDAVRAVVAADPALPVGERLALLAAALWPPTRGEADQ